MVDRLASKLRSIAGIVTFSAVKSFATATMLSPKATSAIVGGRDPAVADMAASLLRARPRAPVPAQRRRIGA